MSPVTRYWLTALNSHRAGLGKQPGPVGPPAWSGALAGLLLAAIVLWAVTL